MTTPILIGEAIKIPRVRVRYVGGEQTEGGYSERAEDVKFGADAKVSFMTTHPNPLKLESLEIDRSDAEIIRAVQSDFIPNMWNFYIKFI